MCDLVKENLTKLLFLEQFEALLFIMLFITFYGIKEHR